MADGITEHDGDAVFRLLNTFDMAVELGLDFFSLLDLVIELEHDRIRPLDVFAMDSLYLLHSQRPEHFKVVLNTPWFSDGLDDEERVHIISFKYDDLLAPHLVQSKTINLPLAGEVNLWIVQHEPTPGYEDMLRFAEKAVRGTERLMGVPFPTSEVIVAVVKQEGVLGSRCHAGVAYYDRVEVGDWLGGGTGLRQTVYHEIAHYYFKNGIGPGWILEGGPEFATWRIEEWLGYSSLEDVGIIARERVQARCVEQGMTNLNRLTTYEDSLENHMLEFSCRYVMGLDFLIRLQDIAGDEVLSAALGELYQTIDQRAISGFDWYVESDPKVYEIILKHTRLVRWKRSRISLGSYTAARLSMQRISSPPTRTRTDGYVATCSLACYGARSTAHEY